ncbi:hypothetical protein HYH02_003108 [Chlamydomonas schloesseri]|uniref:Uncharacterized protein n=1 Tax=Chlamydomonas schloesseri TaxID=2026947 RepID=A0A835WRC4_9CHLO|nr:hypothetical protein HYH02_003108 [Chlamydomonas schloesseri]|eukprot:KAG2452072.1 hypothetical protein HYH02_003108 [Chlamydomonas schloesseri]
MLQRQLGHSGSLSRQASTELPSPGGKSRGVSRNNSFNRRPFAGIPSSRSRPSLLVSCSGPIGPFGGDDLEHPSSLSASASASHTPSQGGQASFSHQPLAPPSPQQPQPPTWEFSPEPYVPAPANLPTHEPDEGTGDAGSTPEPLLFFPPRPSAFSASDAASPVRSPNSPGAGADAAAAPSTPTGFRVPDARMPPLSGSAAAASSASPQPHPQQHQHQQQPLHGGAGSNQVPSSLPRGGGGGGGGGRADHSVWTLTDQPGVDLFRAGPAVWNRMRQVYVILFGVGERDTEGIYSLRAFRPDDGLPHETIIAFECEEEATRYACLLEASMDHTPHVCSIPPRELLSFCLDQTYSCRLEPRGSLLIPPDFNVSVTDWERSLRLREGKFAVLEADPDHTNNSGRSGTATATVSTVTTALAPAAPPPQRPPSESGMVAPPPPEAAAAAAGPAAALGAGDGADDGPDAAARPPSTLARYSGLSGGELDEIRARLERLLSQ